MKRLFTLVYLLLFASIATAQDLRYQVIESSPWEASAPTLDAHTLDASTDWIEAVFQAKDAATNLTSICAFFASETGTGPTYKIGIEGVSATTGIGDGVYKTGTGECSGTFASNGQAAGWKCVTPTGTTCSVARGEWLSISVRYSSGTVDASNFAVFNYGSASQFTDSQLSGNNIYAVVGTAGTGVKSPSSQTPFFMYKNAGRTYGRPFTSASTQNYSSDSASDEYALRFALNCPAGQTYQIAGIRWHGQTASAAKTAVIALYDGTTVLQDVPWDTDSQRDNAAGNGRTFFAFFNETTLEDLTCQTVYRLGLQAGSTSMGWGLRYFDVSANSDLDAYPFSVEGYLSHRADAGAWTDVDTSRPNIDLILNKFNDASGGGGGSGGGGSVSIMTREITQSENTAAERKIPLYLVDATDGTTEETGLSITGSECRVSKNGAASANCAGTIAENETGLYSYEPTTGEVDTVGYVTVRIADAAARKYIGVANINAFDFTVALQNVNVSTVSSNAIENGDFAARGTLQSVTAGPPGTATLAASESFDTNALAKNTALHIVSATTGAGQTKCICSNVSGTDVATLCEAWDGATPTGTMLYSLVPAPHCDAIQPTVAGRALAVEATTGAVSTVHGIDATALKDLFDTDSTTTYGAAVAGSVVKEIADNAAGGGGGGGDFIISSGTAQSVTAGPPTKMRLAASATYGNDTLKDHAAVLILTSSGNTAAVGQVLCIKANAASNDEVTFTRPYKSLPSGAVTYAVIPAPNCNPLNWPSNL